MVTKAMEDAFIQANAGPGPLRARLVALQNALETVHADLDNAYKSLVAKLESENFDQRIPEVGDTFPPFLLPNDNGGLTSLNDLTKSGPAIISFNRGHWCHHCMLELFALARVQPEIEQLGAKIVSIIPERQLFTQQMKTRCALPFSILSDMDNSLALTTGLVISGMDDLREVYLENGVDLEMYQGSDSWLLPIPAIFIVDQDGVVQLRYVDPDFRRRAEPDDIVETVRMLQAK